MKTIVLIAMIVAVAFAEEAAEATKKQEKRGLLGLGYGGYSGLGYGGYSGLGYSGLGYSGLGYGGYGQLGAAPLISTAHTGILPTSYAHAPYTAGYHGSIYAASPYRLGYSGLALGHGLGYNNYLHGGHIY